MRRIVVVALVLAVLLLGACGESAESQDALVPPSTGAPVVSEQPEPKDPNHGDTASTVSKGSTTSVQTSSSNPPSSSSSTPASSSRPPLDPEGGDDSPPDPEVPSALESLVAQARADLAVVLGVAESEISVALAELITWPSAALGCPERDVEYRDVRVDGWRAVLTHEGVSYAYHAGGDSPEPFLCWTPDYP